MNTERRSSWLPGTCSRKRESRENSRRNAGSIKAGIAGGVERDRICNLSHCTTAWALMQRQDSNRVEPVKTFEDQQRWQWHHRGWKVSVGLEKCSLG